MDKYQEYIPKSDLILIGKVIRIGKPPSYWSGLLPAFQEVRYQVRGVLKGKYAGQFINVRHPIVMGTKYVDSRTPALKTDFFKIGRTLVLFLKIEANGFTVMNSGDAIQAADSETIKTLRRALSATKKGVSP